MPKAFFPFVFPYKQLDPTKSYESREYLGQSSGISL